MASKDNDLKRFFRALFPKHRWTKTIFRVMFILILISFITVLWRTDWRINYWTVTCPEDVVGGRCAGFPPNTTMNEPWCLKGDEEWRYCSREFFLPGETYGYPTPVLWDLWIKFFAAVVSTGVAVNHGMMYFRRSPE